MASNKQSTNRKRRDGAAVTGTVTVNPITIEIDGKSRSFNPQSAMAFWLDARKSAIAAETNVQQSTYEKSEALRLVYIAGCIRGHFEPSLTGEQWAMEYYGNDGWNALATSTKKKTRSNFTAMLEGARANVEAVVASWPKGDDAKRETAMTQDKFYATCRAIRDLPAAQNGSASAIKSQVAANSKTAKSKLGDHLDRFYKGLMGYEGDDNYTTVLKAVEVMKASLKDIKFAHAVKPQ